jgi:hypothetical protein
MPKLCGYIIFFNFTHYMLSCTCMCVARSHTLSVCMCAPIECACMCVSHTHMHCLCVCVYLVHTRHTHVHTHLSVCVSALHPRRKYLRFQVPHFIRQYPFPLQDEFLFDAPPLACVVCPKLILLLLSRDLNVQVSFYSVLSVLHESYNLQTSSSS